MRRALPTTRASAAFARRSACRSPRLSSKFPPPRLTVRKSFCTAQITTRPAKKPSVAAKVMALLLFIRSMTMALAERKPVTIPAATTIADGIAVRRTGVLTLELVKKYVDDVVTVDDEEIANAILLLLEHEKTLAEGAGAAAIAALLNRKLQLTGKRVAVVIGGGNIDVTLLSRIIERGLVKDGRLVRLRIHLPDFPGALHNLTGILAQHRANIVETSYDRAYHGVNLGDTAIEITMETRGPAHIAELLSALSAGGYAHERIS